MIFNSGEKQGKPRQFFGFKRTKNRFQRGCPAVDKYLYLFLLLDAILTLCSASDDLVEIEVPMPEFATEERDQYLCTEVKLPDVAYSLVEIQPLADQEQVHHMILFGCVTPAKSEKVWPCSMAPACQGKRENVLYGWGRNAPTVTLPKGTGYTVGPGTAMPSVVLQVHYLELRSESDASGVKLVLSKKPVEYGVGMVAFASYFRIPPRKRSTVIENTCCFTGLFPSVGLATRVHTHALGRHVTLDVEGPSKLGRVVDIDPQQPQGFYQIEKPLKLLAGDILRASCDFDSSDMDTSVSAGHTSKHEMCNLYLMMSSELSEFSWCLNSEQYADGGSASTPKSAVLVPETEKWQFSGNNGAQVSGVAYSASQPNAVWVFHRGGRVWAETSFDLNNVFTENKRIINNVVMLVDRDSGTVKSSFGNGIFLLPHMISEAPDGGLWVVDTGAHQVIKLMDGKVSKRLGTFNSPGKSKDAFCKPTEALETRDGRLFVADGYCNSRIVEFDARTGEYRNEIEISSENALPHSMAFDECSSTLYVANGNQGEVLAINVDSGSVEYTWSLKEEYGMVFAVQLGINAIPFALTWNFRSSSIVQLTRNGKETKLTAWNIPGIQSPHDFAFLPGPAAETLPSDRNLGIVVSETKQTKSQVKKYIFIQHSIGSIDTKRDQPRDNELEIAPAHINTAGLERVGQGSESPQISREQYPEAVVQNLAGLRTAYGVRGEGDFGWPSEYIFMFTLIVAVVTSIGFLLTYETSRKLYAALGRR